MARINLRPWREELRAERQRQFVSVLAVVFIIAGGLAFGWTSFVDGQIEYQKSRNVYIQSATKALDAKIKEINELKKKKAELLARMKVIQDLQGKRPVIVRVFDELVKTLPDGVYFTSLSKVGDKLSIKGVAESNNRVSALMRSLDGSNWFANPNLNRVAAMKDRQDSNQFELSVAQVTPDEEDEGGKKK